jgi:hypothetical protein
MVNGCVSSCTPAHPAIALTRFDRVVGPYSFIACTQRRNRFREVEMWCDV